MGNAAGVRLGVDAIAGHINLTISLASIHFRIDSIACSVCQNLECFVEPILLNFREIRPASEGFALLNDNPEKILSSGINLYGSSQLRWRQFTKRSAWLDAK